MIGSLNYLNTAVIMNYSIAIPAEEFVKSISKAHCVLLKQNICIFVNTRCTLHS